MKNTIKNLIHPDNLGYSKGHTNLCDDGKTYEFFKLGSDGYVYVLCVDTNRCTRYNGEGQNGKRISMDAYLDARDALDREAAEKLEQELLEDGFGPSPFGNPEQELEEELAGDGTPLTEVGKEIAEQAKKKAKAAKQRKPRKSKDIAYTFDGYTVVTLTAKQVDFMHEMVNTMAWDGFDHPLWIDILVDEIGGQFKGKPMTVGAMISTLCEKGLGTRAADRREGRKCTSFELTELGQLVADGLGL